MLIVAGVVAVAFFFLTIALNRGIDRIATAIEAQNVHYGITGIRTTKEASDSEEDSK